MAATTSSRRAERSRTPRASRADACRGGHETHDCRQRSASVPLGTDSSPQSPEPRSEIRHPNNVIFTRSIVRAGSSRSRHTAGSSRSHSGGSRTTRPHPPSSIDLCAGRALQIGSRTLPLRFTPGRTTSPYRTPELQRLPPALRLHSSVRRHAVRCPPSGPEWANLVRAGQSPARPPLRSIGACLVMLRHSDGATTGVDVTRTDWRGVD